MSTPDKLEKIPLQLVRAVNVAVRDGAVRIFPRHRFQPETSLRLHSNAVLGQLNRYRRLLAR